MVGGGTSRVVGVKEVEVPAGKFSAVRVEEDVVFTNRGRPDDHFRRTFWYAPGVGVVKEDISGRTAVLEAFSPGR